jgi:hypothetical protein
MTSGCESDTPTRCGPGTELIAGECLPLEDGGIADTGSVPDRSDAESCGDHAFLVDGVCQGVQPVGGACQRGGQCDTQTCLLEDDGFPDGYCSVPSCNDLRPCTTGSHCIYSTKRKNSICLAFCSGTSECRDGYVCQPLYQGDISVCSPACGQADNCPDQTYCDQDSGKCLLRECDPKQSSDCGDGRICFPDPRNITTLGGLCLSTCDPSDSQCGGEDVCQPLPEDPQHKGICAPPVCTETSDCQVGSVCKDSACQPPARCDDKGQCGDDTTACVGGPGGQCMTKCADDGACTSIHSGLVCAKDVVDDAVCLPLGSFPGSACRTDRNSQCDGIMAGNMTTPMVCENDRCLVECDNGGDALCKSFRATLNCASGVFDKPVCLPSGSYPGGPCAGDDHDQCSDADLGGGKSAKMLCKGGQCLLDCGAAAIGSADPESYCPGIDETLTCAATVYPGSAVCLPQGSYPGGPCAHGTCSKLGDKTMACEDDRCLVTCTLDNPATPASEDDCAAVDTSLACAHGVFSQDVCLPKGSFPGGACGGANHDQCAQNLNGVDELDMRCVSGSCVIGCSESGKWAGYGETICNFADPTLTCAQAANSVCVKACNNGSCSSGFSCLDPGTPPARENACLPNGSFPGAACGPNNSCGSGPGGSSMSCRNGTCVVNCPAGSDGDTLCSMVNSALTCSDAGGGLCVPGCNSGNCPNGLSCLTSENACLPNGTFPGAACASGNTCRGAPMLVCVPGSTPKCAPGCNVNDGQSNANTYCTQVGSNLGTDLNTCTDVGGGLHVCTHQ